MERNENIKPSERIQQIYDNSYKIYGRDVAIMRYLDEQHVLKTAPAENVEQPSYQEIAIELAYHLELLANSTTMTHYNGHIFKGVRKILKEYEGQVRDGKDG